MSTAAPAAAAATAAHDDNAVATFAKLHPKEFHRKFLQHAVRPDGRSLQSARPTIVAADSISSSSGSSLVKVGNTSVVCAIKLEIGRPFDTKPQDGRLVVEVHLGPLCSPKFKSGRATESAVSLSQWLTNAIVNSGSISLSDLCIAAGDSCWVIYADIVCLNFDGNLYDACLLALVQSLRRLQIPDTEVVEEGLAGGRGGKVASEVCISSTNFRTLPVHHTITSTTFGVIDSHILADPTAAEEELLSGSLTVVLDEKSRLCQVHKAGGVPLTDEQLTQCINTAKTRVPTLLPLFKL